MESFRQYAQPRRHGYGYVDFTPGCTSRDEKAIQVNIYVDIKVIVVNIKECVNVNVNVKEQWYASSS